MIATLNGILSYRSPEYVVLDVGGVGYKVALSLNSLARLPEAGQKIFLHIHTAVREDDIALFGFLDEQEKKIFLKLISVTGIGPKLALTILSGIDPRDLVQALHREDLVRLTAISGIGKKTAERMILDLKDKLQELLSHVPSQTSAPSGRRQLWEEALSTLMNLGYNRAVAEKTLTQISPGESVSLETMVRQALKLLSSESRS